MQRLLTFAFFGLLLCTFVPAVTAQSQQSPLKPVAAAVQRYIDEGGTFHAQALFTASAAPGKDIENAVQGAQFLKLDIGELEALVAREPEALSLTLPYNGVLVEVELLKTQVITPDFEVITSEKELAVAADAGIHYRGRIQGYTNSVTAFSFFKNGDVMAMLSDEVYGDRVLGKLDVAGNTTDYILFEDTKLSKQNPMICGTADQDYREEDEPQNTTEVNGCVRVYIEADYELYQNKGSSTTNVTNYLTGMFNQVATLYANEQISTQISTIYVWTTPDNYSNSSSSTALNQFRALRTSFNGNIAHLASYGGNNLGGVAYLDVICNNSYRYAYSNITASYQTVPTYSWTVEVFTHEMGHNLGSNHTQWCGWTGGALDNCYTTEGGCAAGPAPTNGGTIMSYCHLTGYGINFNNGFGTQPGNRIRSRVSAASCLSATCSSGTSCGIPTGLSATGLTQTSATLNWGSVSGATSYNVQWKRASLTTWNTLSGITGNSYNLTGLTANTAYNFRVQANCNGTLGTYSSTSNFTTPSTVSCGTPTNLSAASVTATSANLNWGSVSGATNYTLQWKTAASSTWTTVNTVSGTSYNLTGLAGNTAYNFRVRANCGSAQGAYSNNGNFTTLVPACPDIYESNNSRSTAKVISVNTNITATIATTSDTDWFRFSNSSSARNIKVELTNLPANYNVALYMNNTLLTTSQNTGTTNEVIIWNTSTVLTGYYVYVYPASGNSNNQLCYTLRVSTSATPWTQNMPGGGDLIGEPLVVDSEGFSLFPNPADETMILDIPMEADDVPVSIRMIDMSGRMVLQQHPTLAKGDNQVSFPVQEMAPGVYMVQVRKGDTQHVQKLVIQH